jgi:hypothetical protein
MRYGMRRRVRNSGLLLLREAAKRAANSTVVLAKARTHYPDWLLLKHVESHQRANSNGLWLWIPDLRLRLSGTTVLLEAAVGPTHSPDDTCYAA